MIALRSLRKVYRIHEKDAGLAGSLRAFWRRRYHDLVAVDDVSFELSAGEMVGFLGPNGAGKTTTLKLLAGLLHPSGGEVSVAGFEPRRRQRAFLRSITLVMGHKQQLSWDLAASDTFLVNQAIYEIPDRVYHERLGELTEMLGLHGLLRKQVRKLSLGERMKCELAAALLHRPKVLFLDEPTIGLDVAMQHQVRRFVADYNERHGATVMLTSHNMGDVTALAERVLVIDRGRLVFDGDLLALVEQRAPERRLHVTFSEPIGARSLEEACRPATVRSAKGVQAELSVPRGAVAQVVGALMASFTVVDLVTKEVPVEEVVAELVVGKRPSSGAARA